MLQDLRKMNENNSKNLRFLLILKMNSNYYNSTSSNGAGVAIRNYANSTNNNSSNSSNVNNRTSNSAPVPSQVISAS